MGDSLKAELAGIQATLDASLQREREANERIATLAAERDALKAWQDEHRAAKAKFGADRLAWGKNRGELAGEMTALRSDLAGVRELLGAAWAKCGHVAAERDALKADLSARMSQLNEARAATVEANMALADANERIAGLEILLRAVRKS